MKALRAGIALVGLAVVLAGAPARGTQSAVPGNSSPEVAAWTKRLEAAKQRLTLARQRVARAQAAMSHQRQRHYPRGDAKRAIEQELEQAEAERQDAAQAVPVLLEQARRTGIPRGTLRRYE